MQVLQRKTAPIETRGKPDKGYNFVLRLILSPIACIVWILIYVFWMNSMKCYLRETFFSKLQSLLFLPNLLDIDNMLISFPS